MVAWERWIGVEVGNKFSISRLLSAEGNQAWFLASSLRAPPEEIIVTFFPPENENDGWPGYLLGLRHLHLRKILGAGEESILGGKWRCIAMERADALLSHRLSKEGPLPTTIARELTAHLIDAL